jgi:hypothetical protein
MLAGDGFEVPHHLISYVNPDNYPVQAKGKEGVNRAPSFYNIKPGRPLYFAL